MRGSTDGTWTTATIVSRRATFSFSRCRRIARLRLRLPQHRETGGRDRRPAASARARPRARSRPTACAFCSGVRSLRAKQPNPGCARARARPPSRQTRYCSATMAWARVLMAASCSAAVSPSGGVSATLPESCCLSPATRTMKNSSRFEATIARNFSRSTSGTVGVARLVEHALVELEPRQLAVDEQLGVRRIVDDRRLDGRLASARDGHAAPSLPYRVRRPCGAPQPGALRPLMRVGEEPGAALGALGGRPGRRGGRGGGRGRAGARP